MTVLVIGAVGETAGLVVPALLERGVIVRGLVRNQEQIDVAQRCGAAEAVVGDLASPESLDAALTGGVDGVFHMVPSSRRTRCDWASTSSRPHSSPACASSCSPR